MVENPGEIDIRKGCPGRMDIRSLPACAPCARAVQGAWWRILGRSTYARAVQGGWTYAACRHAPLAQGLSREHGGESWGDRHTQGLSREDGHTQPAGMRPLRKGCPGSMVENPGEIDIRKGCPGRMDIRSL